MTSSDASSTASLPMIQLHKLNKTFRRVTVLDQLDLSINTGERVALIGSNGAGKTTLIRCLLGEYIHKGEVLIGGLSPRLDRTQVLTNVGFVPQLPPPLKMPVGQLIRFAAALCGSQPNAIHAIAERLGLQLSPLLSRQFIRLSGGMKQKLLIAIALGRDTRLLILDEPAASLDPEARAVFFSLLAERMQTTTMLISSHRLDEISGLVNRVIEMDSGRIVLDDKVADASTLNTLLCCTVELKQADQAFAKALTTWQFINSNPLHWQGQIAGPDRLRFLGMVARYAGLIRHFSLSESPN